MSIGVVAVTCVCARSLLVLVLVLGHLVHNVVWRLHCTMLPLECCPPHATNGEKLACFWACAVPS